MSAKGKVVLIAGATGNVGFFIALGLAKSGHFSEVRALIRAETVKDEKKAGVIKALKDVGIKIVEGTIAEPGDALNGVHTVVASVMGPDMIEGQIALVKHAKKAGCVRFVPSDFGVERSKASLGFHPLVDAKQLVVDAIKEEGLVPLVFYVGLFSDYIYNPFFGVQLDKMEADTYGGSNTSVVFTSRTDVGKYVAEVLADDTIKEEHVFVEGDRQTWAQGLKYIEEIVGKKFTLKDISIVDAKAKLAELQKLPDPFAYFALALFMIIETTDCCVFAPEKLKKYSFKPQTLKESLTEVFGKK